MKTLLIAFAAVTCLQSCITRPSTKQAVIAAADDATCSGSDSYCNACKNCKYCKHCSKDGGTCKVCK